MKAKDLRERTVEDLKELEKTLTKDLFDARFKNFTNRLDDTSSLRKGRRELARVKTLILEHGRKGATPAAAPKATKAEKAAAPAKAAAAPKAAKAAKTTTKKTAKAAEKSE
jgi:large subunit ribosomal protein L29